MSKFLSITPQTTLTNLSQAVGRSNVDTFLNVNGLTRTHNIGEQFYNRQSEVINMDSIVPNQRKYTLLNSTTSDSDVFETTALLQQSGWRQLDMYGCLPNFLKVPDSISVPDSVDTLGNNVPIASNIYTEAMSQIKEKGEVSPSVFSKYSTIQNSGIINNSQVSGGSFQYFKLPWGDITLYSSLSGSSIDFPVYPETVSDGVKANYMTMPDMLYQYEPWQLYQSSGPRDNTYDFIFHRDMWTGDHRDGKANELIRFCEANCYPEFNGSMVNTSTVTLYVKGNALISGVLVDVHKTWDGPIGLDGWYLMCNLSLEIIEVSPTALNYNVVKNKPLIG